MPVPTLDPNDPIELYYGDTAVIPLEFTSDNAPTDLSDYTTFKAYWRTTEDSPYYIACTVDASEKAQGKIEITSDQTTHMLGRGVIDLQADDTTLVKLYTIIKKMDVTR